MTTNFQRQLCTIKELEEDLKAEIVIQELKWHWEGPLGWVKEVGKNGKTINTYISAERIIDQQKIAEPDTERREKAIKELMDIRRTTRSCIIRSKVDKVLRRSI